MRCGSLASQVVGNMVSSDTLKGVYKNMLASAINMQELIILVVPLKAS